MAGFNYARSRATAERLIKRFGQPCALRRIVKAGNEWAPVSLPEHKDIIAVDLNERLRDANGTLVGTTQRKLLVSTATGITPTKGDRVSVGITAAVATDDSEWHEISEVRPLAPGGLTLLWEVDLNS
jgi:hypothetical protein